MITGPNHANFRAGNFHRSVIVILGRVREYQHHGAKMKKTESIKTLPFPVQLSHFHGVAQTCYDYQYVLATFVINTKGRTILVLSILYFLWSLPKMPLFSPVPIS